MVSSNNKVDVDLCNRFKKIRQELDLTQSQFAESINTTRVSINAIENGRYNPGIDLLKMLRSKYKLSYDYIIDGS